MSTLAVPWYRWTQERAIKAFLPLLKSSLPHSNPLYNRLQAPQNTPDRHCLFASTIPPSTPTPIPPHQPNDSESNPYTIVFADRSRYHESQIWIFNPLTNCTLPLTASQTHSLKSHLISLLQFLKTVQIPEAPGWPFKPTLKFACLHPIIGDLIVEIGQAAGAVKHNTVWQAYNISTAPFQNNSSGNTEISQSKRKALPEGFSYARVPEDQLDVVLATSSIKRQAETLLALPSMAVLDDEGKMIAWAYVGIDGSLATLYVLPEWRGKGLAKCVAVELLRKVRNGEYRDMGFDLDSGWVHADVKEGNEESASLMRSLGGKTEWLSRYIHIDSELITAPVAD